MLEHTPYSPDLALCDFFLFPKLFKPTLKGTQFESMEEVKQKSAEVFLQKTSSIALTSGETNGTLCDEGWRYIEGEHLIVEKF